MSNCPLVITIVGPPDCCCHPFLAPPGAPFGAPRCIAPINPMRLSAPSQARGFMIPKVSRLMFFPKSQQLIFPNSHCKLKKNTVVSTLCPPLLAYSNKVPNLSSHCLQKASSNKSKCGSAQTCLFSEESFVDRFSKNSLSLKVFKKCALPRANHRNMGAAPSIKEKRWSHLGHYSLFLSSPSLQRKPSVFNGPRTCSGKLGRPVEELVVRFA